MHYDDWKNYHRIRKHYNLPVANPDQNLHFVLLKCTTVIAIAEVQQNNTKEVSIKHVHADTPFDKLGYEEKLTDLLKKWSRNQGFKLV